LPRSSVFPPPPRPLSPKPTTPPFRRPRGFPDSFPISARPPGAWGRPNAGPPGRGKVPHTNKPGESIGPVGWPPARDWRGPFGEESVPGPLLASGWFSVSPLPFGPAPSLAGPRWFGGAPKARPRLGAGKTPSWCSLFPSVASQSPPGPPGRGESGPGGPWVPRLGRAWNGFAGWAVSFWFAPFHKACLFGRGPSWGKGTVERPGSVSSSQTRAPKKHEGRLPESFLPAPAGEPDRGLKALEMFSLECRPTGAPRGPGRPPGGGRRPWLNASALCFSQPVWPVSSNLQSQTRRPSAPGPSAARPSGA